MRYLDKLKYILKKKLTYRGIATLDTSGRESLLTLMPSITSVSPREGSVGGGTLVTIKGAFFLHFSDVELVIFCAITR